jgi:hypothetical protein
MYQWLQVSIEIYRVIVRMVHRREGALETIHLGKLVTIRDGQRGGSW